MNKLIEDIYNTIYIVPDSPSPHEVSRRVAKLCMDHAIEAVLHTDYCCKCPYVIDGWPVSKVDVNESIRKAFYDEP